MKPKAGWVFRLEVVTDNPATLTKDMMASIEGIVGHLEDVSAVKIRELYESLELFERKPKKK